MIAIAATLVASFGANPGALDMYEHVPANLATGRPVVVVLHGCTQTAADIEHAGWDAIADAHGFAVVYPQQRTANQPLDCFDWYDPATAKAEAASIVAMVDREVATYGSAGAFVTGVSAGGAMTAILLATYPDRFAAGSVMSGIPYGCATDLTSASSCEQGATKSPQAWGDLVRAADPGFAGPWPRIQIWQGDQDRVVAPANATSLVAQWTDVHGAAQTPTATDVFGVATRTRYGDSVELYVVAGMGHAISIGGDGCPSTPAMYFEDHGVCATLRAADLFGVDGGGPPAGGGGGGCSAGGGGLGGVLAIAWLLVYRGSGWPARWRTRCRRRYRSG